MHRSDAIFDVLACRAVFVCLFKVLRVLKKNPQREVALHAAAFIRELFVATTVRNPGFH